MIAVLTTTKKPEIKAQIAKYIQAQHHQLASQTAGYSVYDGKVTKNYIGDIAYKAHNVEKNVQYNGAPLWITHFRIATGGDKGSEGLHLQNIDGYIFAHNGVIHELSNVLTKSDSYHFFNRMIQKSKKRKAGIVDYEIISQACGKYGFQGKGFLYDTKRNIFHFFNNQEGYITILEDTLIFSSYKLEDDITRYTTHNVLGFEWREYQAKEKLTSLRVEKIDNTYLKIDKFQVTEEQHIDNYSGVGQYSFDNKRSLAKKTVYPMFEDEDGLPNISGMPDYRV